MEEKGQRSRDDLRAKKAVRVVADVDDPVAAESDSGWGKRVSRAVGRYRRRSRGARRLRGEWPGRRKGTRGGAHGAWAGLRGLGRAGEAKGRGWGWRGWTGGAKVIGAEGKRGGQAGLVGRRGWVQAGLRWTGRGAGVEGMGQVGLGYRRGWGGGMKETGAGDGHRQGL